MAGVAGMSRLTLFLSRGLVEEKARVPGATRCSHLCQCPLRVGAINVPVTATAGDWENPNKTDKRRCMGIKNGTHGLQDEVINAALDHLYRASLHQARMLTLATTMRMARIGTFRSANW